MSYQVFARKYRPQQFSDMIGQEHVRRALTNALDSERLHHAYLFTGMRGVGKTTIARVLAKSLNCETNGVSSHPCGRCSSCKDIEAGSFIDLIEVDAASQTKVEETRELMENVPYAPASGRYKVYLIDEVHMFSRHSFNALLKTLEEPPEHVKFLLATTDPQKVPVTVLSRCLQFNLKSVPDAALAEYLGGLLDAEKIGWEQTALVHIAQAAEGSVRDSLSLVEQAAAFGGGQVVAADVESMLGRLSPARVLDLLEALSAGDGPSILEEVEALSEYAPDYQNLLSSVLSVLHKLAVMQNVKSGPNSSSLDAARMDTLAGSLQPEDVQLYYQIGIMGLRDMPYSPDQRAALEMILLRMLAFKPADAISNESAPSQPADLSSNTADSSSVQAKIQSDKTANSSYWTQGANPAFSSVASKSGSSATLYSGPDPEPGPELSPGLKPGLKPGPKPDSADAALSQPSSSTAQASTESGPAEPGRTDKNVDQAPIDLELSATNWGDIVNQLGLTGMPKQLANNCSVRAVSGNRITLALATAHEHLNNPRFRERVELALKAALASDISIEIELASDDVRSPAKSQEEQEQQAIEAAQTSIREDPLVKSLLEKVDGVLDEKSVKPI